MRALTPAGMALSDSDGGSWSPNGHWIAFTARPSPDNRFTIWMVHSDGTGLHQLEMPHCGGAIDDPTSRGCLDPDWAPDGRRIAFDQNVPANAVRNIYTPNPDGTQIRQVTTGTNLQEQEPDWGVAQLGH